MEGVDGATPVPEAAVRPSPENARAAETRDTREQVLDAFNSSLEILENTPADKLTPKEQASRDLIKQIKEKTLDKDKRSYLNKFKGADGTEYRQLESVPVDDLIDFLSERISSGDLTDDQVEEYKQKRGVLVRNSKDYFKTPGRRAPAKHVARIAQEYERIRNDPRLSSGDAQKDWLEASETITKRRELNLPSDRTKPPPPPPPPPPPEQVRRDFVIANRSVDVQKRAAEMAEIQLRAEMRRGSAWNPLNWPRKIGLRVAEQYYRQVFTERARGAMLRENNTYLDMDIVHSAVRDASHKIAEEREAGQAVVEQLKTGERIEGQKVVEATGALKTMMMDQIIRPVVDGRITNQAQVQELLRNFVRDHEGDAQVQAVFGRDATQYGRLAEYFASDLLETGNMVRDDLAAHRYAIDQLDSVVRIQLANTEWAAQTQARFNMVDRAVSWAESRRLTGWLLNPATIGAAFSIGVYGGMKLIGSGAQAANLLAPGAGLLVGAGVAAARRNHDLKVDMAAHRAERAYGEQIPRDGAPRREALERYAYDTAKVSELLGGGGRDALMGIDRVSLDTLKGADLSIDANREALIRRVAEIKTRLDFSTRERVDLVTFTGKEQVEQGRLGLIKAVVEARRDLRNAGMSEADIVALEGRFTGEWNAHFIQDRTQQENNFAGFRLKNAAGAAVFGGITGLAGGLVSQEVIAGVRRLAGDTTVGSTILENIFNGKSPSEWLNGGRAPGFALDQTKELFSNPGKVEISAGVFLKSDGNQNFELLDSAGNHIDSPPFRIDQDGKLIFESAFNKVPQPIQDEVNNNGWGMQEINGGRAPGFGIDQVIEMYNNPHPGGNLEIAKGLFLRTDFDHHASLMDANGNVLPTGPMEILPNGHIVFTGDINQLPPDIRDLANKLSMPIQPDINPDHNVAEQVKQLLVENRHHTFAKGDMIYDINSGKDGQFSIQHYPSGLDTNGHPKVQIHGFARLDPATGNTIVEVDHNFGSNQNLSPERWQIMQEALKKEGWQVSSETIPGQPGGGTVIDKLLLQPADILKNQGIIETDQYPKSWNFHVLRPDIVASTGMHTHNELTMHLGGEFGVQTGQGVEVRTGGAAPGYIDFAGQIKGGLIDSHLVGVGPKADQVLDSFIARNGGALKVQDMVYVAELTDGKQLMFIPDAKGGYQLPPEFHDEKGWLRGIKTLSAAYIEKSDGHLLPAGELRNNGQIPGGSIVHSLAAERFVETDPPVLPPGSPREILHLNPPMAFEVTPPPDQTKIFTEITPPDAIFLDQPEIIPTPFTPRHPLEPLVPNEKIYYSYYEPLSDERRRLFEKNRSKTLQENPSAVLDPYKEASMYFERQDPAWMDEVESLASQISIAPSPELKAVACIPVAGHEEGESIYETLSNYSYQTANSSQYELMLFVNHPEGTKLDKTLDEINRFQSDHPDMPVRVIYKQIPREQARMGIIRKYLNDVALFRHHQRGSGAGDIILISNDADLKGVSPQYIENFIKKFEGNEGVDGFVGQLDWDPESFVEYPAIHAGTRLFQYLNLLVWKGKHGDRPSSGANFAFRGSIYSGIGGYQINEQQGAEDVILGQAIRAARGGSNTLGYAGARVSRIYTSSRRAIDAWANHFAPIEQWDRNWNVINGDIRRLKLGEHAFVDYDDPAQLDKVKSELELVIDRTLEYYADQSGDKETELFKRAVGFLGINYTLSSTGKIQITDMRSFIEGIKWYQQNGVDLFDTKSGRSSRASSISPPISTSTESRTRGILNRIGDIRREIASLPTTSIERLRELSGELGRLTTEYRSSFSEGFRRGSERGREASERRTEALRSSIPKPSFEPARNALRAARTELSRIPTATLPNRAVILNELNTLSSEVGRLASEAGRGAGRVGGTAIQTVRDARGRANLIIQQLSNSTAVEARRLQTQLQAVVGELDRSVEQATQEFNEGFRRGVDSGKEASDRRIEALEPARNALRNARNELSRIPIPDLPNRNSIVREFNIMGSQLGNLAVEMGKGGIEAGRITTAAGMNLARQARARADKVLSQLSRVATPEAQRLAGYLGEMVIDLDRSIHNAPENFRVVGGEIAAGARNLGRRVGQRVAEHLDPTTPPVTRLNNSNAEPTPANEGAVINLREISIDGFADRVADIGDRLNLLSKGVEAVAGDSDNSRRLNEEHDRLLTTVLQNIRENFESLAREGEARVSQPFITANKYAWQEVAFGSPRTKGSDYLYRGYLMVEPDYMPKALQILTRVARERASQGKGTDFKWLMATQSSIPARSDMGKYNYLHPQDPRIALYGDEQRDVAEVLAALAENPDWQKIEANRFDHARLFGDNIPPRRPGTNAYIDPTGVEWRTLNYNNRPGYSENEAADPDWRDIKMGTPTVMKT